MSLFLVIDDYLGYFPIPGSFLQLHTIISYYRISRIILYLTLSPILLET